MARLTGLNIYDFNPMKFSQEYFCCVLASSVYYLTIAKYLRQTFRSTLKNHKNHERLAQWVFPLLRYVHFHIFINNNAPIYFVHGKILLQYNYKEANQL